MLSVPKKMTRNAPSLNLSNRSEDKLGVPPPCLKPLRLRLMEGHVEARKHSLKADKREQPLFNANLQDKRLYFPKYNLEVLYVLPAVAGQGERH